MDEEIAKMYGQRLRVRACGLCWIDSRLVLVNHKSITNGDFWAPPGGGISLGKKASETLVTEFQEETGLTISPGKFLFACEFLKEPLHAIELFFEVTYRSGTLQKGFDPEMATDKQIIKDVRAMHTSEITALPHSELHGIFGFCKRPEDLVGLNGYFSL